MIYGVGTDLVEIDRVLKACDMESFYKRVFTENERREAFSNKKRLAGDFAVKEAVAKAFGTGFSGIGFSDIEVLREASGKPYVVFHKKALDFCRVHGISAVHVSISDTDTMVSAFAVAAGGKINEAQ